MRKSFNNFVPIPLATSLEHFTIVKYIDKGDLKGFHSIRINDQWRIVFRWLDSNAEEVKIVDYH